MEAQRLRSHEARTAGRTPSAARRSATVHAQARSSVRWASWSKGRRSDVCMGSSGLAPVPGGDGGPAAWRTDKCGGEPLSRKVDGTFVPRRDTRPGQPSRRDGTARGARATELSAKSFFSLGLTEAQILLIGLARPMP